MTAVFTQTARSSAIQSFVHAAVAAVVGCAFIAVAVFVSDLPSVAAVLLLIIGVASLAWAVGLGRTGVRVLEDGQGWRVEITEQSLSWQSPLQKVMASFDVPLLNIRTLRHIQTRRTGKNLGYRNEFIIELIDGDNIQVSENISGVDPLLVFQALESQGVSIERESYHTQAEVKQKHRHRLDKKRAMRAQRSSESTEKAAH